LASTDFNKIDAAFKAGDLDALTSLIGALQGFPNVSPPHDAIGCSVLEYAIYHSPVEFIGALLQLGADPNYEEHDGFPSLIAAHSSGRSPAVIREIMTLLLEFGADIDQQGFNDYTALHRAAAEGDEDLVEFLLASGASASIRTRIDDKETPAEVAEAAGHPAVAERLRRAAG